MTSQLRGVPFLASVRNVRPRTTANRSGASPPEGRIDRTFALAASRQKPFEFQMLYGIRENLQQEIVGKGFPMRVYVPYGSQWYPYLTRRLAERPANLLFFARALVGK